MSNDIPVTQETLNKLMIPSTATLTSALNKRGLWNIFMHNVSPLKPGMKMAGPAFTMRYIPSREDVDRIPVDNLVDIQRVGIERVGPGEVFVIDVAMIARAQWVPFWPRASMCGVLRALFATGPIVTVPPLQK